MDAVAVRYTVCVNDPQILQERLLLQPRAGRDLSEGNARQHQTLKMSRFVDLPQVVT